MNDLCFIIRTYILSMEGEKGEKGEKGSILVLYVEYILFPCCLTNFFWLYRIKAQRRCSLNALQLYRWYLDIISSGKSTSAHGSVLLVGHKIRDVSGLIIRSYNWIKNKNFDDAGHDSLCLCYAAEYMCW